MQKNRLLIGIGLFMAVLVIGTVACNNEEEGTGETTRVTLSELDGSGVTGSATLTATDTGIEVVVTVDRGLEEGSHANAIYDGTCDAIGPSIAELTELEVGPEGNAPATITTVREEFEHVATGGHVLAVQALDGSIVACEAIAAEP